MTWLLTELFIILDSSSQEGKAISNQFLFECEENIGQNKIDYPKNNLFDWLEKINTKVTSNCFKDIFPGSQLFFFVFFLGSERDRRFERYVFKRFILNNSLFDWSAESILS